MDGGQTNDMNLKDLLAEWGLSEFTENFESNRVTLNQLIDMTDSDIKELIPLLGPRLTFKLKRETKFGKKFEMDRISENDGPSSSKKMRRSEEIPVQKTLQVFDPDLILSLLPPLETTLKNTRTGESILANYQKTKSLSQKSRNIIVDILVKDLSGRTKQANNHIFKELGQRICSVFPTETIKTYYISPIKKRDSRNNKSEISKGKIPVKWRNINQFFKQELNTIENQSEQPEADDETNDEVEDSIEWIRENSCALIESVKSHWIKTSPKRLKDIKNNSLTLNDIFENWRILRQPDAHFLIDLDFIKLGFTKKELTEETWKSFVYELLCHTKESFKDETAKNLKEFLKSEDLEIDSRVRAELELLCHLIPTKAIHTVPNIDKEGKKKRRWKVSIAESFESIIQYTALPCDIEELKNQRIDFMHDRGLTVQPYIIVTGPDSKHFNGFYVNIDNKTTYKLPTLIKAIDICFKCFHVFNVSYPLESEHLWLIFQKVLFGFNTKWDKTLSHTEAIINTLISSGKCSSEVSVEVDNDLDY